MEVRLKELNKYQCCLFLKHFINNFSVVVNVIQSTI